MVRAAGRNAGFLAVLRELQFEPVPGSALSERQRNPLHEGLVFSILVEGSKHDGVHALYIYEHDHGPSSSPRFGDQRLRIVLQQVLQGMRRAPGQLTPKSAGTN